MVRFKVAADGPGALTVRFEPLAWEVVIEPGDHIVVEWPERRPGPAGTGTFCHEPGLLTILEPHFLPGRNWARVWDSNGEEITY
ncbi:hypothetical protein ACPC54_37910 [Kitasatospora sp. NPDC094028]